MCSSRRAASGGVALLCVAAALSAQPAPLPSALDKKAEQWVQRTLAKMTLDEKIGQLIVSRFDSTYTPTDSSTFERLEMLVRQHHLGGFAVFGGSALAPVFAAFWTMFQTEAIVVMGRP